MISIMSHGQACAIAAGQREPIGAAVIQWLDPTAIGVAIERVADYVQKNCAACLRLRADDTAGSNHPHAPTIDHVRQAIEFSRKHRDKPLWSCCHAGISRSSATAVAVLADREGPLKSLSVLRKDLHWPNPLIIQHAADITGHRDLIRMVENWCEMADTHLSEEWPSDVLPGWPFVRDVNDEGRPLI